MEINYLQAGLAAAGVTLLSALGYSLYTAHKIKKTSDRIEKLNKEFHDSVKKTQEKISAFGDIEKMAEIYGENK